MVLAYCWQNGLRLNLSFVEGTNQTLSSLYRWSRFLNFTNIVVCACPAQAPLDVSLQVRLNFVHFPGWLVQISELNHRLAAFKVPCESHAWIVKVNLLVVGTLTLWSNLAIVFDQLVMIVLLYTLPPWHNFRCWARALTGSSFRRHTIAFDIKLR